MAADEVECTAYESDWGQNQPNFLMHPPCACPGCDPEGTLEVDEGSWLFVPGRTQRVRVEPAQLGRVGRDKLG